jgi:hypothetical protein
MPIRCQRHRHGRRCDKLAKALRGGLRLLGGGQMPPPPLKLHVISLGRVGESDAVSFGLQAVQCTKVSDGRMSKRWSQTHSRSNAYAQKRQWAHARHIALEQLYATNLTTLYNERSSRPVGAYRHISDGYDVQEFICIRLCAYSVGPYLINH